MPDTTEYHELAVEIAKELDAKLPQVPGEETREEIARRAAGIIEAKLVEHEERQWIDTRTQIPDAYLEVIVSGDNGGRVGGGFVDLHNNWFWIGENDGGLCESIAGATAWRLFPATPKGSR